MNHEAYRKMQEDLKGLQRVLARIADPRHPDVLRAVEEYERSVVRFHSLLCKFEETEYGEPYFETARRSPRVAVTVRPEVPFLSTEVSQHGGEQRVLERLMYTTSVREIKSECPPNF